MPMNQLLFDHQIAAMKADRAGSAEARKDAVELMGVRAERIAEWRSANGLFNLGWPHDERQPATKGR